MDRVTAFPPVLSEDAEILILGSAPSVKSLETGFYYGHPRNAFWRILADTFHADLPVTIDEKTVLLIANGIALWDTIEECTRTGSMDSAIRDVRANAYGICAERCPRIRRILLNGKTAAKLFFKNRNGTFPKAEILVMPSTSPAFTMPYEEKLLQWENALKF